MHCKRVCQFGLRLPVVFQQFRTHPTDGRAKCIWVSPLLHANKHIGRDHYAAIHAAATAGIADKDYLTMLKCMEKMYENLTALDAMETAGK